MQFVESLTKREYNINPYLSGTPLAHQDNQRFETPLYNHVFEELYKAFIPACLLFNLSQYIQSSVTHDLATN